ncbi:MULTISPECIES: hypothetical protein [Mesorhizobium]|uniref:hypothetical protein n=3 Tax=Phyllobacteriaceae TaxID=69277 RepID=UPI000ACAC779|nr:MULTISPECIES: hypothetical protein [Mesorhizobium]MDF3208394.1 hypothetical protein [Mesorhizobium sp. LMG15046]MDF3229035.1 hypothetical protein [Mesorhizobium sp. DSM 30133]RUU22151.1 hypothetical protein EOC84_03305 [Mesorhizobium sp. Primo-B]RVB91026.1 hypothetical protein EN880_08415 [Mesorhizobium sp. M7A.F.Ca.AU.002.03.1.1]RVB95975.1 hypothetical protein EN881_05895 [Mesorhizobium sp. M7A.F.Ca.AU.002.04.1.1]
MISEKEAKKIKKKEMGIVTFTISVLWLSGLSIGRIAMLSGRSKGSIRGIVHRNLPTPREELTMEERQTALDHLKSVRCDEARLSDKYFVACELSQAQEAPKSGPSVLGSLASYMKPKPTKPAPPPMPDGRTREGRKEIQRRKQEARHQEKVAVEQQAAREMGGAVNRGLHGSALEYLHDIGTLSDPIERRVDQKVTGISSKERRKEAGRILRGYMDGCRVGGMSSVDFDRVGTGSNSRLAISAYRLQAIHAVGAIRDMMPDRDFQLIERVVDQDEFVWDTVPSSQARTFIYEAIRRALDVVAVFEEMMGRSAFATRWGFELPMVKVVDRDDARRMSNAAEDILRQAR